MTDVVVGIDGSSVSASVFARGLPVRALHVWQTAIWVGGVPGLTYDATLSPDQSETLARSLVDEVVDKVLAERSEPQVPVHREVRHGAADKELLAASEASELLVLGGRGHGHVAS